MDIKPRMVGHLLVTTNGIFLWYLGVSGTGVNASSLISAPGLRI